MPPSNKPDHQLFRLTAKYVAFRLISATSICNYCNFAISIFDAGERQDWAGNQLKEIKNGRLAMLAFGGIVHHYFITGKGPVELLTNFQIGA